MQSERQLIAKELVKRANATGAKVYGFGEGRSHCEQMPKGGIPKEWEYACVEGDKEWTRLPSEDVK